MKTREEVITFCANLQRSMLAYLNEGQPVHFAQKNDLEPIEDATGMQVDAIYYGATMIISVGRPAARQIAKDECKYRTFNT